MHVLSSAKRWMGLALAACCILASEVHAQRLTGRVAGPDGAPMPGVNVVVPALGRGATTDADGRYALTDLPADTLTVAFRFVGFEPEVRQVDLRRGSVVLDVTLHPAVIEGMEVVVTAGRGAAARLTASAQALSVLEGQALEDVRGQTLGETLERLPGVTTLSTGPSIAKPVVRGLHSQRVLVLNAGVPQEGQQWGGEHAPEIDPFAPARIEVVKGAAGVEYGAGALGGVIRVEPRDLPATPGLGGELSLSALSNSGQGAGSLLLEGGLGAVPGLGWRVQGSLRQAGDARTPGYVLGNSAFQERNGALAVGYHQGRVGVEAYFSHFGTTLGIYRGAHVGSVDDLLAAIERGGPAVRYTFGYRIDAPKQVIAHDLVTLRGHYDTPRGSRLDVQYGFQHNRRREYDAHRGGQEGEGRLAFDLSLASHSLEARLRSRPVGRWFGVVGVSGMNQANVNARAGYLIPNFRALTGGLFARATGVYEALTLELGLRGDSRFVRAYPRADGQRGDYVAHTHRYGNLSGVVGAVWRFAPAWSVAANVGSGWRAPSVNELYNFGVHHGTAQFEIGNAALTSERSLETDVTLRYEAPRARLEVSAFSNQIAGFIYLRPDLEPTLTIRGAFPTFRYAQADARLRGLDGQAEVQALPFLRLGLTASLVRGFNRTDAEPLLYMPADRLALRTTWRLPRWGALHDGAVEVEGRLVARQTRVPEGVDYAPPPPGYALFGARYNATLELGPVPVRLGLAVENALNTRYRDYLSRFRYYADDPGRSFTLRLAVPLGTLLP